MGMILGLATISDEAVGVVLKNPPLIWKVLAPEDADEFLQESTQEEKGGFFSRLFGGSKPEKRKEEESATEFPEFELLETDLDKAWHGLHFLFTGTAWEGDAPLNFLVSGGKEVGDLDVGYGPARVLTSAEVRAVAEGLEKITNEDLRARFDPGEMMKLEIYPTIWDRDPEDDDTYGYLEEYFQELKVLVRTAAEKQLGLVVSVS